MISIYHPVYYSITPLYFIFIQNISFIWYESTLRHSGCE